MRALATRVLVGVQPVLTQVPPTQRRSMRAVRQPLPAMLLARGPPPCPEPTTTASKCCTSMVDPASRMSGYGQSTAWLRLWGNRRARAKELR